MLLVNRFSYRLFVVIQENMFVSELKRFEEIDNKVILYFVELSNEPICVPFTIKEHAVVENHVAAIVNLYDYYKPEYKVSTVRLTAILILFSNRNIFYR